ncbi:DUF397 domain-containing protein [Actinomadura algeriensis]|uniref:DUF397 domain-containing protein n=1 Tax=Actinomadura algeriensis TaxID=1679523 RepID=UPI00178C10DE|nr:DUF397 domain-containing protein [Actinomadura algeriensis]
MSGRRRTWRRSSSSTGGEHCGEVVSLARPAGLHWRKSAASTAQGNECVEVAGVRDHVGVRDSKDPDGAMLVLTSEGWWALTRALKQRGEG